MRLIHAVPERWSLRARRARARVSCASLFVEVRFREAADTLGTMADEIERPGLLVRVRGHLSLTRVQAVFGIIAALLSIGGALYGYLRPGRAPDTGEVVAIVQEAKSGRPVTEATVELLTPKDALVTTLALTGNEARRQMKEGTYRLRVSHPRYATEVRQIHVLAGQTAEIHVRLAPRAAAGPSITPAERAVNEGVESLKKIFR
jgi:Carboxypeptidase regulatory-like domain